MSLSLALSERSIHDHISNRSASTGGNSAARRAGYVDVTTPITTSVTSASAPDCHDRIIPENRAGIGSRLTSAAQAEREQHAGAAAQQRQEEALEEELPLDRRRSSRRAPCGRRSRASAPSPRPA